MRAFRSAKRRGRYLAAALRAAEQLDALGPSAPAVHALRADLTRLRQAVVDVKEQALAGVALLDRVASVDLRSAILHERATYERLASPMRVCWDLPDPPSSIQVAGGEAALRRVLANLLENAREGDGRAGASRVVVTGRVSGPYYRLEIVDDGPGLHGLAVKPVERAAAFRSRAR